MSNPTNVQAPQPKENLYILTQSLGDALVSYLVQRPMLEVERLVAGLRAVQPIPETLPPAPVPENAVPLAPATAPEVPHQQV